LIASRREKSRRLNVQFAERVTAVNKNLRVEVKTPDCDRNLQVVDFASWAIYGRCEYGNDECYNIIADKIIGEY
jgi:hypothetical protein